MQQLNQLMEGKNNDLTETIAQALNEIKCELGDKFDLDHVNLAELERRTGVSRAKLRRLKEHDFVDTPHGLAGRKATTTVLTGFTGMLDDLLSKGVTNSSVCYARLTAHGYTGGLTVIKENIAAHRDLVPAKRQLVAPQGNRGRRYQTAPGEAYQMDWGFVEVENENGVKY